MDSFSAWSFHEISFRITFSNLWRADAGADPEREGSVKCEWYVR